MIDHPKPPHDVHGPAPLPDQEPGPMSEAYRDRAPDIEGRLDLIERALARVIETLERIERRLPDGSVAREPQP
jgi:hypothetical protein